MEFVHPVQAVIPGVQGKILSVLVETTAELILRTIARLADVSLAQASRTLPHLVESGIVERREVPPSSLFRLVSERVAAWPLGALSRSRDRLLKEMGRIAEVLEMGSDEIARSLVSGRQVWNDVLQDGQVVFGLSIDELGVLAGAEDRSNQSRDRRPSLRISRQG